MPKISILWGQAREPGDQAKTYAFDTDAELAAFKLGVEEMSGWMAYEEVDEGYVVPKDEVDPDWAASWSSPDA